LRTMIELMSRGGGVGINISSLRPQYAPVLGVNGRSSGAVSWGGIYSYATGLVSQGGSRRGALLLLLADWHPDIEAFIDAKRIAGKMENANISIGLSTQFEKALVNDDWWNLEFPDTTHPAYESEWDGDLWRWKDRGYPTIVYRRMRARELWRKITQSAWASGEPGLVRLGYDNEMSNSWYFSKLIGVNPCLTGDTLIYTSNGLQRMDDLYFKGNSVTVMADSRLTKEPHLLSSRVFMTGIKPVFKLITQEGYEVRLTKDHKVMTNKGWVEAGNLTNGDKIYIQDGLGGYGVKGNYDVGKILGWLIGDGHLTKERAVLSFYDVKRDLASSFVEAVNSEIRESLSNNKSAVAIVDVDERDESIISSVRLKELVEQYGITASDKLQVPESVFEGTQEMQKGFLQALFSADGHVETYGGSRNVVVLSSVSVKLLKDVQKLLLNFGIYSHIYRDRKKAGIKSLPDGRGGYKEYECKAVHDLRITSRSIFKFKEQIGFLLEYKQSKLEQLLSSYVRGPYQEEFTATFVELIPDGEEPVYDITVPHIHAFAANGLVVHNCGEQPLSPWGVCNLGHINLGRMIKGKDVDWDMLRATIYIAVEALDNVIDITPYFFDEQKTQAKKERRIGLGTLGLAEMLVRLGIANDGEVPPDTFRYGSKRCLAFIDKLYKFIAETAYTSSVLLAAEKGSFPAFDADKFLESGFAKGLPDYIRKVIKKQGIRNATLLTSAPTGSVGSMMGTSTGIEPYFSWKYYRNSRLGLIEVLEQVAKEWLEEHSGATLHDLPPYFVTAMELTPEEHIRTQAAIQRWIDSAISKTVNMPSDATIDDVDRAYRLAIELGCKGCTVYRDGSRSEQVLTTFEPQQARPNVIMEEDVVNDCPNGSCAI
jgi:ribonucleoside-diphosphate reductase alpha chain